jgi:hypothetical protein
MGSTRNTALEEWMAEHGHSSNSLAEAVNQALVEVTGKHGGLDGSSVRDWKAGRVRWPKTATRKAIEDVTGLPVTALGFVPRSRTSPTSTPQEVSDMKCRTLVGGIAAAVAIASKLPAPASAVSA